MKSLKKDRGAMEYVEVPGHLKLHFSTLSRGKTSHFLASVSGYALLCMFIPAKPAELSVQDGCRREQQSLLVSKPV